MVYIASTVYVHSIYVYVRSIKYIVSMHRYTHDIRRIFNTYHIHANITSIELPPDLQRGDSWGQEGYRQPDRERPIRGRGGAAADRTVGSG